MEESLGERTDQFVRAVKCWDGSPERSERSEALTDLPARVEFRRSIRTVVTAGERLAPAPRADREVLEVAWSRRVRKSEISRRLARSHARPRPQPRRDLRSGDR